MTGGEPGSRPAPQSKPAAADSKLDVTVAPVGDEMRDLPRPIGPEQHRETAKILGCRRDELIGLSPDNDPFYKGTPAHLSAADWFAELWERFGYRDGVHLRRIHYRIVTLPNGTTVLLTSGEPFRNDNRSWHRLTMASTAARILGQVDVEAFIDRRNKGVERNTWPRRVEPSISWTGINGDLSLRNAIDQSSESATLDVLGWWSPGEVEIAGYDYSRDDQPVLVELWVEKSTTEDVLRPVCADLGVNYVEGAGYESITAAVSLLRRAQAHYMACSILYVSDFDPAGNNMPVATARHLEFWRDRLGIDVEITVEQVALTREQVDRYDLPSSPDTYDTELDALEALHPGVLAGLVRDAVWRWRDPHLRDELNRAGDQARDAAQAWWQDTAGELVEERDALRRDIQALAESFDERQRVLDREAEQRQAVVRRERDEATAEIQRRLDVVRRELWAAEEPFRTRERDIADEIAQRRGELAEERQAEFDDRFEDRLEGLAERAEQAGAEVERYELPPRPSGVVPDGDRLRLLFDTRRSWLDQLAAYQAHKNGVGS
jgi:hypothetical protein